MHPRTTPRPQACVKRLPRRRTALAAHSPACPGCGWREASRRTSCEGPGGPPPSCGYTPAGTGPPCCPAPWVLRPGERTILVQAGETAQYSTMAPQASGTHDRAAEILCILGRPRGARALWAAHATAPGQRIHVTAKSGARSQLVNQAGCVGGTVRASTGDGYTAASPVDGRHRAGPRHRRQLRAGTGLVRGRMAQPDRGRRPRCRRRTARTVWPPGLPRTLWPFLDLQARWQDWRTPHRTGSKPHGACRTRTARHTVERAGRARQPVPRPGRGQHRLLRRPRCPGA